MKRGEYPKVVKVYKDAVEPLCYKIDQIDMKNSFPVKINTLPHIMDYFILLKGIKANTFTKTKTHPHRRILWGESKDYGDINIRWIF